MEVCNCFVSIRKPPNLFFRLKAQQFIRCSAGNSDSFRASVLDDLRKETEKTLEWHSICSQISTFTSTSMGRSLCQSGNIPFGCCREESEKLLSQTTAAALLPQPPDFSGIDDLGDIVRSSASGELLSIGELCLVQRSLRSARGVLKQLEEISLSGGVNSNRREAALKVKETQQVQQELRAAKSQIDHIVKNFENQLISAAPGQVNALLKESETAIAAVLEPYRLRSDSSSQQLSNASSYIPRIGDQVHVRGFGSKFATVVEASGNDTTALVQFGKMKILVKKNDIKPVPSNERAIKSSSILQSEGQAQRRKMSNKSNKEVMYGPAVQTSRNRVDLRGMRAEEAADHLHMLISATQSGKVLFVIHGMGTGVVKERVLEVLSNHPRVAKFEQESPMNYGCTVVYVN